ncbi:unnamed protein product [Dracunculus medinensis]|uniref:Non-structural maintenance of chromosomes element 4 n=1 Tax=Dracunculus medinensis TaxID=318479 RepID=A0A3P7Q687_DRAME|nr:unnamed protein product [Dracunculus medinensis]
MEFVKMQALHKENTGRNIDPWSFAKKLVDVLFNFSMKYHILKIGELDKHVDPLTKRLDHIMHCLKKEIRQQNNNRIGFFQFCFHPTDFSRSVENVFYISFLIREGKVQIDLTGNDGLPELDMKANQAILSFSYSQWQVLYYYY